MPLTKVDDWLDVHEGHVEPQVVDAVPGNGLLGECRPAISSRTGHQVVVGAAAQRAEQGQALLLHPSQL